ncbi:MAG: hypothetical protein ACJ77A_07045 [Actinomycetota bacterium]
MRRGLIALVAAGVVMTAAGNAWTAASPHDARIASAGGASIDPGNFVRHVTNPFYPLRSGTLFVYRGTKDGAGQTDRVYVTHRTKRILGVRATVVRDVATHGSRVLERTLDWFAQDRAGNVWYLGEATREFLPNGHVSTEGSWEAGVHGARPGIVMEADPRAPDGYRQEFYAGHAEDQAWVLRRGITVVVPYGRLHRGLRTLEWTPLEPGVIDKKAYAWGVGLVSEESATGPRETAELVRIRRPQ